FLHPSFPSSSTATPLSFFFYCHAHHRHLHSFPTRRSSDLATCAGAQLRPAFDALVAEPGVARLIGGQHLDPAKLLFRPLQAAKGDRKSTRLNSSHDQISYAVFCLKKKKKNKKKKDIAHHQE